MKKTRPKEVIQINSTTINPTLFRSQEFLEIFVDLSKKQKVVKKIANDKKRRRCMAELKREGFNVTEVKDEKKIKVSI